MNIGCEAEFSASAPVLLQYSHDAGRTWALVREGCYPGTPGSGVCEGSGRELREPTVYNTGDYEQWTRVTVVIPRNVAARWERLRLIGVDWNHPALLFLTRERVLLVVLQ